MARAHEHLASARYAEAAGAFRAVLRIDPNEFQAHFGLADALVARGQHGEAVEGLVAAAESCTAREDHGAALTLYGKALAVDPMRLELHLDVAMAEAALGRMEAAQSRLEHLAEVYMQAGRTDEAAEVYRCLAGWEEGEEGEEVEEIDAADEAPPQRSTQVPTAAPAQPPPRGAVPMSMMPTSETVVIPTILITPDGQLYQVPIEQQAEAWAPASDSVPRVPAELLEVVHSAPIDLAAGGEIEDVERTVVAYPPPPPSLPENYESAAHTVNRKELEAAVVAAMNNLAQLEEEDQTLIMQRLPPQSKTASHRTRSGESRLPEFVTRSRMPKPELPPEMDAELEEAADLEASVSLQLDENFAAELAAGAVLEDAAEAYAEPEPEPVVQEPAPESKLRINRAPRPPAKPSPVAAAAAAGRAGASSSPGKPAAARPISPARAGGGRRVSPPEAAPARASASKPAGATSKPAAAPARASTPAGAGKPAAAPARASAPAGASKPAAPARASASKPAAPARASASKPAAPARASASKPATMTSKPAASPVRASTPAGASKPAGSPARASAASKPAGPPARAGTSSAAGKPAPSDVPPPGGSRPPAGPAARPSSAVGSARPPGGEAPKPTRPDNPLAERLRRRAGLQKPDASPSRAEPRGTEPIIVRSPSSLPPRSKK